MAKEIAVYLGEDGKSAPLQEKGRVVVYGKWEGQWQELREIAFSWGKGTGGLKEMRQKVEALIDSLEECRIFVGLSVIGVPYQALEKANFSVWECEGEPLEFLEYILNQEEEAEVEAINQTTELIPVPQDLGNGCYFISLKEIQQKQTQYTSKQVLLPFLRQGQFYSLKVICSHLPKWLELELLTDKYTSEVEQLGPNELSITLGKKTCS